jgi:probable rRNA maturation factor
MPELSFTLRNRQRSQKIDSRHFRRVLLFLLRDILRLESCELCFHLVDAPEMTRVNEHYLDHEGSTDVITFDHHDPAETAGHLYGEIYLCVPEALRQAPRFQTHWTDEITRYAVHGVLHLCGYDDLSGADRAQMKRAENRCLRKLRTAFNLAQLERP